MDKTKPSINCHAFLVGVELKTKPLVWTGEESVLELSELAKTAGLKVQGQLTQKREHPDPRTYVGKGIVSQLQDIILEKKVEVLIADDELSPAQQRNLEKMLDIKVMDRSSLVLSIFADHARTHEAMLQVELAQLDYLLPRLTRMWTHLSRLGGGIGTRGPGETQLEVDRRRIQSRITHIKKDLKKVIQHRHTIRQKRETIPLLTAALVGYTNAGKSSIMNRLTEAGVLSEDQLFATLDTTTRNMKLPNNEEVLLSDTVGFIQKLPHQLVDAFKSTLEEVNYADILIHVVDASHPKFKDMIQTTIQTLNEIGIDDKPVLMIFNKEDQLDHDIHHISSKFEHSVLFSATKNKDISPITNKLCDIINSFRKTITVKIPYKRMDIVSTLHQRGDVLEEDYGDMIQMKVTINKIIADKILGDLFKELE